MPGPEGVLVIDKPAGMTSHDVVARVRRLLGTRRVGHTGTLDPSATGVLVVCVGRATRLVDSLRAGTKTYAARAVLGLETDSQDLDGRVVARTSAAHVDEGAVCEALEGLRGPILQVPPMVSAVRVDGERLHVRARRGEVIDRPARPVTVHDLVLEDFTPGEEASFGFVVTCSAGTYVRTLAHDLGATLGVGGALASLRRVANGPFGLDEAITLEGLADAVAAGGADRVLVRPIDALARTVPVIDVATDDRARALAHGRAVPLPAGPPLTAGTVAAAVRDQRLVAVVEVTDAGEMRPRVGWSAPEEFAAPTAPTGTDEEQQR